MALHPNFPSSPYAPLVPAERWFPADEELRSTAYEKLLPPLVAKVRAEVAAWRETGYAGASATSVALLRWWFEREHRAEEADGSLSTFRYYFAQREAVETVVWLYDVRRARDKFDLLRFDASGAVSSGMFAEEWPRYVLKRTIRVIDAVDRARSTSTNSSPAAGEPEPSESTDCSESGATPAAAHGKGMGTSTSAREPCSMERVALASSRPFP